MILLRRTSTLIGWWEESVFRVGNYATRKTVSLDPDATTVLTELGEWRSVPELRRRLRIARINGIVKTLRQHGLVESSDESRDPTEFALASWSDWSPFAASFHFMTKDIPYASRQSARRSMALLQEIDTAPPPTKDLAGPAVNLPPFPRSGEFPEALLSRRSWRRFGRRPLALQELATLLGLTWGVQKWLHIGHSKLALKTAPSGGATHSLETYVVARNIRGLPTGVYHYDGARHRLVRLERKWSRAWLTRCLAGQDWFAEASAVVLQTAVFPRVQWKYRFARAYRTVLLEAGHFCQTFCLAATWLRLAPFCTAALEDTLVERSLELDGVTESVVYAMGVGPRPPGTVWAPWPEDRALPRTSDPAHRRARRTQREVRG